MKTITRYRKIRKPEARKLFKENKDVYMLPGNANINSPWINYCLMRLKINITDQAQQAQATFDQIVNEFEYYNCHAPFRKYAWFYTTYEIKVF